MIILIIVTILSLIFGFYCLFIHQKINTQIEQTNIELKNQYEESKSIYKSLIKEIDTLEKKNNNLFSENNLLENSIIKEKEHLSTIQEDIKNTLENQTELSKKVYENYCNQLEFQYKEKQKEYSILQKNMENAYEDKQLELMAEAEKVQQDLDKIKSTRAAAIEASRREKEIENNLSYYCISISELDKNDIAKLESLKPSLNKPRVLSMLIWQTWFLKPLKSLSINIVGEKDKTGIYKITNIKTKECYIGQAVSIKDRFVDHVKCGLGIDTPAGNKLYKAMQEFGVWNFSFEVLEECDREQLNEKEKYYIELYDSYNRGYNSNKGIGVVK